MGVVRQTSIDHLHVVQVIKRWVGVLEDDSKVIFDVHRLMENKYALLCYVQVHTFEKIATMAET